MNISWKKAQSVSVPKHFQEKMSSPYAKKRRYNAYQGPTISAGAMASPYNKKVAAPASQAQVNRLQKQVNAIRKEKELKSQDTALSFTIDATGEVPATGQLCLVPAGDTQQTRGGGKITVKSVQIRSSIGAVFGAAATASTTAHIYVVQDTMPNKAAASVSDVFTGTSLSSALRNVTTLNRFKILRHWWHTFTPQAGQNGAYNNDQYHLEMYLKCNIPLEFDSTAGAVTELTRNNIFLIAGTDTATDDLITVSGRARITFYEGA